jgi:hypothetical protein
MLIVEKKKENEIKEKLNIAFSYINENIPENAKHETHPEIRRAATNRWSTQIQEYAAKYQHNDDKTHLPKKPPNAWDRKVLLINDPESFPKLRENEQPKKTMERVQIRKTPEKILPNEVDLENKLKEIEDKISKNAMNCKKK